MNTTIFTQLTTEDLKHLIKEAVNESLHRQAAPAPSSEALLNLSEAARFLRIAKQTLYSYTSRRKIPFLKKAKKLYFQKAELEAWLNTGRRHSLGDMDRIADQFIADQKQKGGKR